MLLSLDVLLSLGVLSALQPQGLDSPASHAALPKPYTLPPTPCPLHPAPYTLPPTPKQGRMVLRVMEHFAPSGGSGKRERQLASETDEWMVFMGASFA